MSLNQSSFEKSESQYRKSGRSRSSGLPIGSSGGRGDGGWESAPPTATSLSTSRRGSNATGNVEAIAVNATAVGTVEKRGQVESPLHGASSAAVPVRKAPSSQAPAITSDRKPPTIAAKDASKAFPLRFGSISPGFMNGMQVGTTHTHSHAFHANYMLVVFQLIIGKFLSLSVLYKDTCSYKLSTFELG